MPFFCFEKKNHISTRINKLFAFFHRFKLNKRVFKDVDWDFLDKWTEKRFQTMWIKLNVIHWINLFAYQTVYKNGMRKNAHDVLKGKRNKKCWRFKKKNPSGLFDAKWKKK